MYMLQQPLNKKAVSLIVSYVLLISIGLSIAGLVFGWLKFYVNLDEAVKCPEGVSLNIIDESYSQGDVGGNNLQLNLTLQNRGRFDIEGYLIRVHNRTRAIVGIYTIYDNRDGSNKGQTSTNAIFPLSPGNSSVHIFNSSNLPSLSRICFIEVQPFIEENGKPLACSQVSTRKISCS